MPAIGAFVPIVLYFVVNKIFGDKKLALLSAMLFSVSRFQIFMLSYMFRRQVGHLFILLSLLIVFNSQKFRSSNEKPAIMTLCLFFAGIVLSNYWSADFGLIVLFGLLITPIFAKLIPWFNKLLMQKRKNKISVRQGILPTGFFLFYCAIALGWLAFFARTMLIEHIETIDNMFSMLYRYGPSYIWRVLTGEGSVSGSAGSAIGGSGLTGDPILNIWYYSAVLLPICGYVYALLKLKHDRKRVAWTACFFITFFLFAFTALMPASIGPTATFSSGFLVFSSFTALAVYRPNINHWHQKVMAVAVLSMLAITLPMNMSLINHQSILHYHTKESVPAEIRAMYFGISFQEVGLASWMTNFLPEESWITASLRGNNLAIMANHTNVAYQSYARFSPKSKFLIADSFFVFCDVWYTPIWGIVTENVTFPDFVSNNSIVFSDGETFLILKPD